MPASKSRKQSAPRTTRQPTASAPLDKSVVRHRLEDALTFVSDPVRPAKPAEDPGQPLREFCDQFLKPSFNEVVTEWVARFVDVGQTIQSAGLAEQVKDDYQGLTGGVLDWIVKMAAWQAVMNIEKDRGVGSTPAWGGASNNYTAFEGRLRGLLEKLIFVGPATFAAAKHELRVKVAALLGDEPPPDPAAKTKEQVEAQADHAKWLRVCEAAALYPSLAAPAISQAATAGTIINNGKHGHARRLDRASVESYVLARKTKERKSDARRADVQRQAKEEAARREREHRRNGY